MEDHITKLSETSRSAIAAAVKYLFFTLRCEDGTELIERGADYDR